jgi:hypothetical protein
VARSGSWNRYAYVEGDPANGNDPSGLLMRPTQDEDVDWEPDLPRFPSAHATEIPIGTGQRSGRAYTPRELERMRWENLESRLYDEADRIVNTWGQGLYPANCADTLGSVGVTPESLASTISRLTFLNGATAT